MNTIMIKHVLMTSSLCLRGSRDGYVHASMKRLINMVLRLPSSVDVLLPGSSSREILRDSHSEPRASTCRVRSVSSSAPQRDWLNSVSVKMLKLTNEHSGNH